MEDRLRYYMDDVKFVRDLAHGYIYLTEFELKLIDTPEFQRLKDIRQLTCQHVYPSARHSRFEHSLGVMDLTKQAIKNLNRNGIIMSAGASDSVQPLFDLQLQFNAALAALLHDVGHCPFSHLGEKEFDKDMVWKAFCDCVGDREELAELSAVLKEYNGPTSETGSRHEQMSCIVILTSLYEILAEVRRQNVVYTEEQGEKRYLEVDFELLIRSIIGLQYPMKTLEDFEQNKRKNVIVSLINSDIFDMDKLDYIMRDSILTGLATPEIDTRRLFRNIYLKNDNDYSVVFTNRAVPALQNMIEARDELYMYVYNHHACVFSDFICSYIFRRLDHNARAFVSLFVSAITDEDVGILSQARAGDSVDIAAVKDQVVFELISTPLIHLGIVPKRYLFSPEAMIEQYRSDSDMISLLHDIYYALQEYWDPKAGLDPDGEENSSTLQLRVYGSLMEERKTLGIPDIECALEELPDAVQSQLQYLEQSISRVFQLIHKYLRRDFLKPWWKTNFEFTSFIKYNFRDEPIRDTLCRWICRGDDMVPDDEFRSQLAKHVIGITKKLYRDHPSIGLLEALEDGEFFVIERSAQFFDTNAISKLNIVLKSSEILGSLEDAEEPASIYYTKALTSVIPQRDYYSLYAKNSFYIFSKQLSERNELQKQRRHYHMIEQIFVFVATALVSAGGRQFQLQFVNQEEKDSEEYEKRQREIEVNEGTICEELYQGFLKTLGFENVKDHVAH